ncbi:hypothetical protein J4418_02945 [Candidatus Woesearchaeota archaeon]|nr:hypothetical protein [Candidatus Woesearchaeota archaeon]
MDRITKEKRSRIMSSIRSVNTSVEIKFRKLLFANGLRGYRNHYLNIMSEHMKIDLELIGNRLKNL